MASRSNEMERMAENGTATFANPDDYQAGIGDAGVNLIVTGGGDFKARLTWLRLRRFHVLRGCENLPRIAFISLSPAQVSISFPTSADPPYHMADLDCSSATSCFAAAVRECICGPMEKANGADEALRCLLPGRLRL